MMRSENNRTTISRVSAVCGVIRALVAEGAISKAALHLLSERIADPEDARRAAESVEVFAIDAGDLSRQELVRVLRSVR